MQVRDHFRAHGRKYLSLPAIVRDPAHTSEADAHIKNLGLGGACVELAPLAGEAVLRVDSAIVVEVHAPSLWDPLVLRARVAWVRRAQADRAAQLGVRFEHSEQGSLFALFQLLGSLSNDP